MHLCALVHVNVGARRLRDGVNLFFQCRRAIALGWFVLLVTLGAAVQIQEILC